jgi:hypothetical protein
MDSTIGFDDVQLFLYTNFGEIGGFIAC